MTDQRFACGIDLIDMTDWRNALELGGELFISDNFTESEQKTCAGDVQRLAARFAAKEAVVKAMGTGFTEGIGAKDIEIVTKRSGQPAIQLHGDARNHAELEGITEWSISLSHEKRFATAIAIATRGAK